MHHRKDFCPAGQKWGVGRPECRALGESDEEIIDKARTPMRTGELRAFVVRDLHLREKKTGAAKFLALVASRRPAAVESPVPKRKNNDVSEPKQPA